MAVREVAFKLPHSVVSPMDFSRIRREAQAVIDFLEQTEIRQAGEPTQLPKVGKLLDELLESNDLNVLHKKDRAELQAILEYLKANAPTVHISFSVDPSSVFMEKLVSWLRREIHPYLLVRVGLRPTIGAGCAVRTTNKYFDLSVRESFDKQKSQLLGSLKAIGTPAQPVEVANG